MSRAPSSRSRRTDDLEAPPESDRFDDAPHPRETYDLFGHEAAETTMLDAYRGGRLQQSWIIGGREGIGKATLAWRFARFLLAYPDPALAQVRDAQSLAVPPENPAARKVEALSHGDLSVLRREWNPDTKKHRTDIRVEDARRVITRFHQAASEGGWRIAIVDSAEDLNRSTANALLKLIEEPPPKSLFLFVSHQPAQILATIRSRSRMLHLAPLSRENAMRAIQAIGTNWADMPESEIADAVSRAGGSIKDALRLLGSDGLKQMQQVEALLQSLPRVDWKKVTALAESLAKRDASGDYEAVLAAIFDWIDAQTKTQASNGASAARLAPYAQVWEKFTRSAREADIYNLDRRPVILSIFSDLADAVRRAA